MWLETEIQKKAQEIVPKQEKYGQAVLCSRFYFESGGNNFETS